MADVVNGNGRGRGFRTGCLVGCLVPVALVVLLGVVGALLDDGKAPEGEKPSAPQAAASKEKVDKRPPFARKRLKGEVSESTDAVTVEEALAELDGLIGLQPVKDEVKKFVAYVQVSQKRTAAGLKVAPMSYHMVFTGNPGTGKTTVARIMAKIYRALGIVKKGQLVETDRGGLVAGYTGQTAIKTGKVIDSALDGVLFIDEAYALVEGGQRSYGDEAIATLLKRMEDDRDRLVVIIAGYTDEMKKFIDANPGLQSRFNRYIQFSDYSAKELALMFRNFAKKNEYALSPDVEHWLDPAIGLWTKNRDRKFGNGRYVRNLFEKAVERQAMRVARLASPTTNDLMTITLKDVGISLKNPDASQED